MRQTAVDHIQIEYGHPVNETNVAVTTQRIRQEGRSTREAADELSFRRMASNCGPTYRLNDVTSYNKFKCNYIGEGVDDRGNVVRNPFQSWKGTLPSCDRSLVVEDSVMDDVRTLAWDAASGEEAALNKNEFVCSIVSIPIM